MCVHHSGSKIHMNAQGNANNVSGSTLCWWRFLTDFVSLKKQQRSRKTFIKYSSNSPVRRFCSLTTSFKLNKKMRENRENVYHLVFNRQYNFVFFYKNYSNCAKISNFSIYDPLINFEHMSTLSGIPIFGWLKNVCT